MTAMFIKSRARKPLEMGKVQLGWHPHGVGGFPQNSACVSLQVGDHKLFITELEWIEVKDALERLREENPARA